MSHVPPAGQNCFNARVPKMVPQQMPGGGLYPQPKGSKYAMKSARQQQFDSPGKFQPNVVEKRFLRNKQTNQKGGKKGQQAKADHMMHHNMPITNNTV